MKLLDRQFLKLFLKPFLVTLLICVFLFLLADFFGLTEDFFNHHPPVIQVALYFLYRLVFAAFFLFPLAALLGGFWGLNSWRASNQWTAVLNSGVSPVRLLRSPLLILLLLTLVMIFLNIYYIPRITSSANQIRDYVIKGKKKKPPKYRDLHLTLPGGGTMKIGYFDPGKEIMKELLITYQQNKQVHRRIDVGLARFKEGRGWKLISPTVRNFTRPGEFKTTRPDSLVIALESPGALRRIIDSNPRKSDRHPEEFGTAELEQAIRFRNRRGLNVVAEKIFYHWKYSYPLGIFVFGLLGMYLAVKTNLNRPAGIGLSLLLAFVYWVLFNTFLAFGKSGYFNFLTVSLAPYFAAYFTPGGFLLAVICFWRYQS